MLSLARAARSMTRVSRRFVDSPAAAAVRTCSSDSSGGSSDSSGGSSDSSGGSSDSSGDSDSWQRSAMSSGGLEGNSPKKYRNNFDRIFGKAKGADVADVSANVMSAQSDKGQAIIDQQAGQIVALESQVQELERMLDAAQTTLLAFAQSTTQAAK